jgi:hypothetical protein
LKKKYKPSLVVDLVSISRTALKSLAELPNSRLIFHLIVGATFAYSLCLMNINITSGNHGEADMEIISVYDVNNKYNSKIMNKHNILLVHKSNTNEVHKRSIYEFINKQQGVNYNQAQIIPVGIDPPFQDKEEEKRSDLFYYILGILILIVSAFILRQRYKQYLEEKDRLNP